MVSNTTVEIFGSKEIPIKSTGHEKFRVSVYLTGKANGSKSKRFIVSKEAVEKENFIMKNFNENV